MAVRYEKGLLEKLWRTSFREVVEKMFENIDTSRYFQGTKSILHWSFESQNNSCYIQLVYLARKAEN